MREVGAALLLAGLVALAGCGGVLGGVGAATEPGSPTPTPVHVAAPGIGPEGVERPARVARAHAASLRDQSYTVHVELTVTGQDGAELGGSTTVVRVGADPDRFAFDHRTRGRYPPDVLDHPHVEAYSNGTHTFEQQSRSHETTYRAYRTADVGYLRAAPSASTVGRYLAVGEAEAVEPVRYDGWIAYRLQLAEPDGQRTVVAVVDTFGFVHELEATFPAADLFPTPPHGTVRYRFSYTNVGNTTVEPPPWLEEARRITRNQTYVGQG